MPSPPATRTHGPGWRNGSTHGRGGRSRRSRSTRDAVAAGDPSARTRLAGWLGRQEGREAEVEQVYRAAVAAGDPTAWARLADGWVSGRVLSDAPDEDDRVVQRDDLFGV